MKTTNRTFSDEALRGADRLTLPALMRRYRRQIVLACVVAFGVIVLWFAGNAVLRLPWQTITRISVYGTHYVSAERIRDVADIPFGAPLFGVNVDSIISRVESVSWVARVTVRRRLSGTFEIHVVERRPIAMFWSDRFHLVDVEGFSTQLEAGPPPDVPVISGLSEIDSLTYSQIHELLPVLRAIDEIESLRMVVSEISYSDAHHVVLKMAPGNTPVWLPRHVDRNRLILIASLVTHHPQTIRSSRYIDARFVGHVAVKS